MTISFWVAVAALTALALAFIAYPLFYRSRAQQQSVDRRGQNLRNYRQRLAELESDRDAGRIDASTFELLKEELDGLLLDDVGAGADDVEAGSGDTDGAPAGTAKPGSDRRSMLGVALVALIALPLLSFILYERWGASDALAQMEMMQELQQDGPVSPEQVEAMVAQLTVHLESNPDNADGWALLARTQMQLQNYAAAADAYEQLAGQVEGSPVAATAWGLVAQARYLAADRQWPEPVKQAIAAAREIDPDEVNALGLLGIAAFEREEYRQAAKHWARILEVKPDYPQYASIANGIASAYRALGERPSDEVIELLRRAVEMEAATGIPASAQPAADSNSDNNGADRPMAASVDVRVELSTELPVPDPDTTVFVFATAVDGPRMPLAAVRLSAGELPATVTLDDSQAMTLQARLSGAETVVIGARVSRSGSATPAPGDMEGRSDPVPVSSKMGTVTLVIDQQIP